MVSSSMGQKKIIVIPELYMYQKCTSQMNKNDLTFSTGHVEVKRRGFTFPLVTTQTLDKVHEPMLFRQWTTEQRA